MDQVLELLHGSEQGPNDAMMWTLLRHGIIDASVIDKLWDGSTQSMRYSAMLVGRLWGLLAGERTRVSPHPSFLFPGLNFGDFQGDHLEQEQIQMKKDLAEVKAYTEAMADSNRAWDVYVDKEQDKFFCCLNWQRGDIDALKDHVERLELRARALELENKSLLARLNSMVNKLCFCTQVEVTSQMDSFIILAWLRKD